MGASDWHYVVDYQDDLPRVLAELQEQVLATADFDRFIATEWYVNRWEGRATVLYEEGLPHQMAFWGISGD